jgi:hypothetical protein
LTSGAKLLGSSNSNLFAGTLGGGKMYRSNNNGGNWSEIQPPVTGVVPECGYYFNGNYFSGLNSSTACIYYSTNDGTTWNSVSGGPQTTVVRGFLSLSSTIFAYTSNKGIYRSTDGGSNWSAVNTGLTNLNVAWMETLNTKIFAATIGGGIFVSSDNGVTWTQSNAGITSGALNAAFIWRMGTSLYYYEQGGSFYTSNNEGTSWNNWVKPSIMGLGINEIYRNGANLFFESRHFAGGGLRDSIYFSVNEGKSWTNITSNLSAVNLNASGIIQHGGFVFIAYNLISPGFGIYRNSITVGINDSFLSSFIQFYPNPFADKIEISDTSNKNIKRISVYDNHGKMVLSVSNFENPLNTSSLNSGFYIIEVTLDNNMTIRNKMIK